MGPVAEALEKLTKSNRLTYFGYVTAKFCLLVDPAQDAVREDLNLMIKAGLLQRPKAVHREAELYLLMCDFLASPDVPLSDRRDVFTNCIGGQISNQTLLNLEASIEFADWNGTNMTHLLRRKELRPVYS